MSWLSKPALVTTFVYQQRATANPPKNKRKRMRESVVWFVFGFKTRIGHSHKGGSLCGSPTPSLSDIAVLICRGLASLDVLLVDEHFYALLDHTDTGVEPGFGLIDDLYVRTRILLLLTDRTGTLPRPSNLLVHQI